MDIDSNSKLIGIIGRFKGPEVYDELANNRYSICQLVRDIAVLMTLAAMVVAAASIVAIMGLVITYAALTLLMTTFIAIFGYLTDSVPQMHQLLITYAEKKPWDSWQGPLYELYDYSVAPVILLLCMITGFSIMLYSAGRIQLMSKPTACIVSWVVQKWQNLQPKSDKHNKDSLAGKIIKSVLSDIKTSTCSVIQLAADTTTLAEDYRNGTLTKTRYGIERAKYRTYYSQLNDGDTYLEFWEYAGFDSHSDYLAMVRTIS